MNRDEIIQMAGEIWNAGSSFPIPSSDDILRFAALVAAAEREACLEVIDTHRIPVGNSAAGEMACEWTYAALKEIAADIRARGEE